MNNDYILKIVQNGESHLFGVDLNPVMDPTNPRELYQEHYNCHLFYHTKNLDYSDNKNSNAKKDLDNLIKLKKEMGNNLVVQNIYGYLHSGLKLSLNEFSDKWDSGIAGYIYADKRNYRDMESLQRDFYLTIGEQNQYLDGSMIKNIVVRDYDSQRVILDEPEYWLSDDPTSDVENLVFESLVGIEEMECYPSDSLEAQMLVDDYYKDLDRERTL